MLSLIAPVSAKVTEEEAKKLGSELTPLGANPNANADGSIPAWKGDMKGVPQGVTYGGTGSPYPDPYASEKPILVIDGKNWQQHVERLSEGQQALFKQYPETFKMNIYPSHRQGRYFDMWEKRTHCNAVNT